MQAVSETPNTVVDKMVGMQGGTKVNASSRVQMNQRSFRQEESKDRQEMQKESRMVRCTFLFGSVWCIEKKVMRRYKGTFDIFFGVEHRMREEEMEDQFNKEAKQVSRFAADAARITDENASIEDRTHKSGGVFVAVDSNLGTFVGKEGAVWVKCVRRCAWAPMVDRL